MNCFSLMLSLVLVYLTINAGTTDSSVISNPIYVQDFYRTALNKLSNDFGEGLNAEKKSEMVLLLSHILNELSIADSNSEMSLQKKLDDDSIKSKSEVQKRSKYDTKRTQDMSRLAMRILKRNGQQTSRVAYRILKKKGSNAARIAMRVLRKRDPQNFDNFNRVTRASPYSNIGGYFGGMSLGQNNHFPYGLQGMNMPYYAQSFEDTSDDVQKRSDCSPNCEIESITDNAEEE